MFIGAALLLAAACNSGKQYTVKGTITGDSESLVNGKAYLFNRDRENPVRDTAEVINRILSGIRLRSSTVCLNSRALWRHRSRTS